MGQTRSDKIFFHVFPTLKVEDDIQILFEDVEVRKITTNSHRDFLRVHIFSRHLIQKKQILQMEQRIKEQLFAKTAVNVEIIEEYVLSGQYTPEMLMEEYRESILLELREKSMLAANMFAQAKIHYEKGNIVCLELLDTIVSEGRKEEILKLLDRIFTQRFHMTADIRVTYREPDGEGTREYDEQRIQQEINAIFERPAGVKMAGNDTSSAEHTSEGKISGKRTSSGSISGNSGTGRGKKGFKKNEFQKKDFHRPVKTGDDPNLIYGRNFDDEPIMTIEMNRLAQNGSGRTI